MLSKKFVHICFFLVILIIVDLGFCDDVIATSNEDIRTWSSSSSGLLGDFIRFSTRTFMASSEKLVSALDDLVTNFSRFESYHVAILLVLFAYPIYWILKLVFVPLNRVRPLGDVGYIPEYRHMTGKEMSQVVTRRRLVGDVPPVYPNGWFGVLESSDLKVNEVKNISCLGKQLAVFRAADGRSHIIDAYCPHMGSNMAVGGLVKGDRLECPFHGWQFRGDDGKCMYVPYCEDKHVPNSAKVTSYCSVERNGFIYVWFHAEGLDPTWDIPIVDEIAAGDWKYGGRTEHFINAHIEEIPENGADVAHLAQVHGPVMTAGIDLRYTYNKLWSFARHDWVGQWTQDSDNPHIGPGIVHLEFESPFFGKGVFLQTLTPVEPLVQRLIHHVYVTKFCPVFVAKFFLYSEALMVERDIMIWNNKQYLGRPLFLKSKEDSQVGRHRRWYAQFYTENSPRITDKAKSLDW